MAAPSTRFSPASRRNALAQSKLPGRRGGALGSRTPSATNSAPRSRLRRASRLFKDATVATEPSATAIIAADRAADVGTTSRELPSDDACVEQISQGNAESGLQLLQDRYGTRLLHFIQGIVRDGHLAQDVLQEVWQRVFTKHHLYRQGTNFRAWIFEVARNQARSALRSGRHIPRPVSGLTANDNGEANQILSSIATRVDRSIEEREFMVEFEKAVASLSDDYRKVFTMCVRQGTAYAEAGRKLSLPTGTVAIRIMRARKQLYRMLERHLDRLRRPPACFQ